jgi:hypothetical protein
VIGLGLIEVPGKIAQLCGWPVGGMCRRLVRVFVIDLVPGLVRAGRA